MAAPVPFDWKGWLAWVAATMLGAEMVVLIVYFLFPNIVNDPLEGSLIHQLAWIVLIGLPGPTVAIMQWTCLRRRIRKAAWWIAVAAAGWYMVLGLSAVRNLPAVERFGRKFETTADIISLCLLGVVMSLPQWFLLQRRFFAAGFWIAARPLGWLAGYGLFSLAGELRVVRIDFFTVYIFGREVPDLVGWSAVGELFGIGLGAVTGAAMVWILKKPKGLLNGEGS